MKAIIVYYSDHNRLHASDVLQATYYMVTNSVAACSDVENTSDKREFPPGFRLTQYLTRQI